MNTNQATKNIGMRHNVSLRVLDQITGDVVQEHSTSGNVLQQNFGHNSATNTLINGIAHYLTGDSVLNQGYYMLSNYIPRYISLGTMGLINQDEDEDGYPVGIGSFEGEEEQRYIDYMKKRPGFGADGYDENLNNERAYFGLGPIYQNREAIKVKDEVLQVGDLNFDGEVTIDDLLLLIDYVNKRTTLTQKQLCVADINNDNKINEEDVQLLKNHIENNRPDSELGLRTYSYDYYSSVNCELISESFPRATISLREVVPETNAEVPKTIDVVFSAMISTGALAQFREPGKDYLFITEAGLWSRKDWNNSGDNGLLAGYRIVPPNSENWDMHIKENRKALQKEILRVGTNQIVQVTWKIQIGSIEDLSGIAELYPTEDTRLRWDCWGPREEN